jgi:hypothetical protein
MKDQTAFPSADFDYKHPQAQALIANAERNLMCIDLIWRILKDPHRDFTASDMEYWDEIHDAVRAALIKREWQGLTDDDIEAAYWQTTPSLERFARAIEAKLKDKNICK